MAEKYPTWVMLTTRLVITEEAEGGVPDCLLIRDGGDWFVKWRTSQHWDSRSYPTLAAAKAAFANGLVRP